MPSTANSQDTTQGERGATQRLLVPDIHPGTGAAEAAELYARAGFYLAPVHPKTPNHAGRFLGKGWPEKTRRSRGAIEYWFTPYNLVGAECPEPGIALHVGRSGAIAFDVDAPEAMPSVLRDAIEEHNPPYQATRNNLSGRGHYLFALPEGVMFGNSVGRLGDAWGDVRGKNGIIVAQPTPHLKADQGGRYEWMRTGPLPELPQALGRELVRPKKPPPDIVANNPEIYLRRTIKGLVTAVIEAENRTQNNILFWAACRFGEMVANGLIEREMAKAILTEAAWQMEDDPGNKKGPWTENDIEGTVESGLTTGAWTS